MPSVQVYFFQNAEHPKIGYFGYNKLSFDRPNMFLNTQHKDFGFGRLDQERFRTLGEKMKQRQTNVDETDLWETIVRAEAQNIVQCSLFVNRSWH